MKRSIIKSKYIFSLTTIIIVIALWFVLSLLIKNTYIFPTLEMLKDGAKIVFVENAKVIPFTLIKIFLAILISSLISFGIVLLYILKKDLIGFFTPILSFIHVVPTMGISLYLYFFIDEKIIPFMLVVMVTVPIIVEGLITAYDNIDKGIVDVLKLEQISSVQKIFKIYLPLMLPYILMTLLQSISLGIKALVMGEYLSFTTNTLGGLIYAYQTVADTSVIIVILLILFVISVLCEIVIKLLQSQINKHLLPK